MTLRRKFLFAGVAAALAGGAGLLVWRGSAPSGGGAFAALGRGVDDVSLLNQSGDSVRWGELNGSPRVVFFGFTNCPVICPVTVWELNDALDRIGAPAASVSIDFVSIDPARDTPERLREFFSGFGARVRGYSGSATAIARIAAAFEVVYSRRESEQGGYTMDHTATAFLVDSAGRVRDVIAYGSPPEVIEARLRALVAEAAV